MLLLPLVAGLRIVLPKATRGFWLPECPNPFASFLAEPDDRECFWFDVAAFGFLVLFLKVGVGSSPYMRG